MGTGRDLKAVRRDGTEFPVEIGLTPLDADDGFLILATVVDISARHDVEEALSHRAMELEKTNERLARFAYIASHDLQEPLRKLVAFSEFLEEAIAAADRSEIGYANEVLRASALRARKLVDDLVTYSAITSDAQKLQGLNLRDQIKLALEACAKAIAATKAEIKVEVPRLKITADRTQFIRLVDNLLANALKFCKPNYPPKITIHAAHGHDGAVQLSIADNGIGIDPEYHATIFEPLKRLHPKGKHPGSGVGLAICKSIADRHGWEITVKSRPGDGATFLITIPPA